MKIHGKEYIEVKDRILEFRDKYKGWSLTSKIVSMEDGIIVMQALILDEKGVVRAMGTAYEKEGSTNVNETSYVENCETSAWGRALANLGIGIIDGVASADEVVNAIQNQSNVPVGKHKGKDWDEVPEEYLIWAADNATGNLQKGAAEELKRRWNDAETQQAIQDELEV